MKLFFLTAFLLLSATAWAGGDSIILKNGTTLEGDILFASGTGFVISVDGKAEHISISDIRQINFGPTVIPRKASE